MCLGAFELCLEAGRGRSRTQSPYAIITAAAAKLPHVEGTPGERPQKGENTRLLVERVSPGYGNAVWKVSG